MVRLEANMWLHIVEHVPVHSGIVLLAMPLPRFWWAAPGGMRSCFVRLLTDPSTSHMQTVPVLDFILTNVT